MIFWTKANKKLFTRRKKTYGKVLIVDKFSCSHLQCLIEVLLMICQKHPNNKTIKQVANDVKFIIEFSKQQFNSITSIIIQIQFNSIDNNITISTTNICYQIVLCQNLSKHIVQRKNLYV